MEIENRQPGARKQRPEITPSEVAGLQETAVLVGQDEPVVLPVGTDRQSLFELFRTLTFQGFDARLRQVDSAARARRGSGSRGGDVQCADRRPAPAMSVDRRQEHRKSRPVSRRPAPRRQLASRGGRGFRPDTPWRTFFRFNSLTPPEVTVMIRRHRFSTIRKGDGRPIYRESAV